jgi:hypothetical protein
MVIREGGHRRRDCDSGVITGLAEAAKLFLTSAFPTERDEEIENKHRQPDERNQFERRQ